ncbi:TonB-dependent siderophore receptor [Alteromonas sp. 14N.309.X.WAT.G.H12]|uniref:TonB-dependent siderophore receptor n=1 Tax=Alteromonas sp. 14N.309.X.WAT.G.H12 TaxID=3120824 RepID=UPI002FD53D74
MGNSAGTINYVRKRPTNDTQGEINIAGGSFDFKRIEADYSTLLTDDGKWAGRVMVAAEDKGSYLDGLENDRVFVYGVVDGQITDNSILTMGVSYQDANTDGNMWGALVYNCTDGTQAEWDVSATTAQEWTMWDTINTTAFVEYAYTFDNNWEVKSTYNVRNFEDKSKLFYVYGTIDKDTGLGLYGYPGRYGSDFDSDLIDITAMGEFTLFGNTHEAVFGISSSRSTDIGTSYPVAEESYAIYGLTPAFPYALDAIDEPVWSEKSKYSDIDVTLNRYYGSTRLNLSDNLLMVVGFNAIKYTREGTASGVEIDNDESEISPYIGATWSITDNVNGYVSYSNIYQPQEEYNYDGYFIDPTKGVNTEIGVKASWLDKKLVTTFALYAAEQDGLAEYAGVNLDTGNYYYTGTNVQSEGFEVEVVGNVTDALTVHFAYARVDVEDDGADTNLWAPRNVVNLIADYKINEDLSMGMSAKWRSETENTTSNVKQGAYLLANAFVNWQISDALSAQVNVNNITDEKYITSLSTVGYYGAPRNAKVSLSYTF